MTRPRYLVALLGLAGCFNGYDPNPRSANMMRLFEVRIDRNKENDLRHTQYALRKFGENIVFAVKGDSSTRTFGFTGERHTSLDAITYELADKSGTDMVLDCKVETIAVHPRAATYMLPNVEDPKCDGKLAWNMAATIPIRVLVCDQRDAAAKPAPGLFWHAGPIRLAPGPGIEEIVEQCPGDDAAIFTAGYRSLDK